jgi:hypothetical protein
VSMSSFEQTSRRGVLFRSVRESHAQMVKDQWTELLMCENCWQSGPVHLSQPEDHPFEVDVQAVPVGFKVCRLKYGQTFLCMVCDQEAITSRLDQ